MSSPGGCPAVQRAPNMARMALRETEVATPFEHALADEILAEVARQRLTSKSVQDTAGVKPRAWTNYLTARVRHIPMPVVVDICDALGVRASDMLRRAEDRVAAVDPITARLEAMLSPAARAVVEQERERLERERAARDAEDPPDAARGGRRSA